VQRTQADHAAVRDVVVGIAWIDDTDAPEGDALLRGHPRQGLGEAQAQRVLAAVSSPAASSEGTSVAATGPYAMRP
jgi:hypothetical protein